MVIQIWKCTNLSFGFVNLFFIFDFYLWFNRFFVSLTYKLGKHRSLFHLIFAPPTDSMVYRIITHQSTNPKSNQRQLTKGEAVGPSSTLNSSSLNNPHLGTIHQATGTSNAITTGKPIAAFVWTIAKVTPKPTSSIRRKRAIREGRTERNGVDGGVSVRSRIRWRNFWVRPEVKRASRPMYQLESILASTNVFP